MEGEQKERTENVEPHRTEQLAADFETAIAASGFGRFNVWLLLVASFAAMASVFETAVISFILPRAECDLSLSLLDKGLLNAIIYAGMITSAIPWGYLADKKGRKKLLIWGYLADVVCIIGGATSQNVIQLMTFKFLGGFVMCGPFAVLMSYLSEFHGKHYRHRVMMLIGIMFSTGAIMLPVLALAILPQDWEFHIFQLTFHSWQVYLAVCATPSLLSSLLLNLFPESPRFLMSQGRNSEALEVFNKIYSINKHKSKDPYPIKELIMEVKHPKEDDSDTLSIATIEAVIQVKAEMSDDKKPEKEKEKKGSFQALFSKQYFGLSIRVCLMNFFILLGHNTMRLWLPQLFASIKEYELISGNATTMCTILEYNVNKTESMNAESNPADSCEVVITPSAFYNNIIVAVIGLTGYLVAGTLINAIGNKGIQVIGLFTAGSCGIGLYWAASSLDSLIITALYVCMGSISSTSAIGTSVNLFPTSFRTMIISLSMMFGRMGSITGNVLFPIFMSFGCIPPFLMVSLVMYIACTLAAFLPSTHKLSLK